MSKLAKLRPATLAAYRKDQSIRKDMEAHPRLKLIDGKPVKQNLNLKPYHQDPIRHEVAYVDHQTGEVTDASITENFKGFVNHFHAAARKAGWAVQVEHLPNIHTTHQESSDGLSDTFSAMSVLQLRDLRYGIFPNAKDEFLTYYDRKLRDCAHTREIAIEHLGSGLYAIRETIKPDEAVFHTLLGQRA